MRVLVTGAAGFIGQHVCRLLKEQGHYVMGMDCQMPDKACFDAWFGADITTPLAVIPGLDAVIHLAAIASPRECEADPCRAYLVNVHGTWNVLQMALASGAKRVVFPSSAHVYGIPPRSLPTKEQSHLRPQSCYTTTKILAEELCRLYWMNYQQEYTILRLFNTYGPGQGLGYFVPDMLERARHGRIELWSPRTTKDFVYVTDVARAFMLALEPDQMGTFNVGSGEEISLSAVAEKIAQRCQVPLETQDDGMSTRMCADISWTKEWLRWAPQISLDEGIDAVCQAASQPVPS